MWSKRELASQMFVRSGLSSLARKRHSRDGVVVVLNYHRIGDPESSPVDHGVFSATAEAFDWQMGFLKRECQVITPTDLFNEATLDRGNYVLVTFDDGYRDNHDVALPILRSHGVRATFFIATGYVDRPQVPWWDEIAWMVRNSPHPGLEASMLLPVNVAFDSPGRQRAIDQVLGIYKKLPGDATRQFIEDLAAACGTGRCPPELGHDLWMTWDMIRNLQEAGMTIGGHTVNHPILSQLPRFQQEEEIVGCLHRLSEELKQPTRFFAYPRGKPSAFNDDTRACLYEARIERAFSFYGGLNVLGHIDAYDVRRTAVEMETHNQAFEAIVSLPKVFAMT
jgi:peptidoglycan/xylan/chitin deacetylase (PgdA/CDA1 family)